MPAPAMMRSYSVTRSLLNEGPKSFTIGSSPKGWEGVAGGRSVAEPPDKRRKIVSTLKGCEALRFQYGLAPLQRADFSSQRTGGLRPPATFSQPCGLKSASPENFPGDDFSKPLAVRRQPLRFLMCCDS